MEGLSRKKLIQFDLEKELEETLPQTKEGQAQLSEFFLRPYEIYTVDQFIKDCPSFPDTNKDIIKREIISSIGATLAIEGTLLGEEEIEESFAKAELQKKLDNKEKESVNAKKAYNYIVKSVETCKGDFVHSEEQIKMIHHLLTDDVESISPNVPGQYRNTMAKFGEPRRVSLCKSETEIIEAMHRFVEWLNAKGTGILTTNPIVKALMAHYYLAEIHPFGDGNGRTARALEALVLYVNRRNPSCFAVLSRFWSAHRNEYIIHLGHIRDTCNPCDFLVFGMNGYVEEVKRVKQLVLKKLKQLMLQDYAQYLFRQGKINSRALNTLMLLIDIGKTPYKDFLSTIKPIYSDRHERTRYRDFKILEDSGLMRITKENEKQDIEPNYEKLEALEYIV